MHSALRWQINQHFLIHEWHGVLLLTHFSQTCLLHILRGLDCFMFEFLFVYGITRVAFTVTQKTVWMFCKARLCWQFLHEFLSINHEKIITRKPCFLAFSWYHFILVIISFYGNISIFVFNTHPDSFFAQVAICTDAHQTYYGDIRILQNIHYM